MADVPPPPNTTPLTADSSRPSPTWARWLHELWAKLREVEAASGGGGGGGASLSNLSPQDIGTASAGVGTDASRYDHVHAHGSQLGGLLHANVVASGAAGFMSGTDKSKLDGISASAAALSSASPADVGTTAAGVAATAARADHVHAHGNQLGGSLHAVAVAGVSAGFVSASDQTKLDNTSGVNTGDGMTPGQILAMARGWPLL